MRSYTPLILLSYLQELAELVKGQTSLVLFGTKMNVATEPLKRGDLPPPEGYIYGQAMLGIILGASRSMLPCTT